jgi:uncharacterized protein with PQ loop repeat
MYHTYRIKSVKDISTLAMMMRFVTSLLWTIYCIRFGMWDVGVSWVLTLASSIQQMYYLALTRVVEEINITV